MSDTLVETLDDLLRPHVDAAGLDVVDIDVRGSGGRSLLRVVVDRKGGVDLATCQRVSRALADVLDDADPLGDRYVLEVTSPGTDWPLGDRRAFDRVEGRTVRARIADGDGEERELVGEVVRADADAVVLRDEAGREHAVTYRTIVKATQVLPW